MIQRAFVDTDVILDVALARKPFCRLSKVVLDLLENKIVSGFTSSNCIANLYYILRKSGGDEKARFFLSLLVCYITVIPIDHPMVEEALISDFSDFEDGLQYYSAARHRCDCIITRNLDDYTCSEIDVYTPREFALLVGTGSAGSVD